MSQASAGGGGRAEVERTLIQRSLKDDLVRAEATADPRATVEQELGTRLPEEVRGCGGGGDGGDHLPGASFRLDGTPRRQANLKTSSLMRWSAGTCQRLGRYQYVDLAPFSRFNFRSKGPPLSTAIMMTFTEARCELCRTPPDEVRQSEHESELRRKTLPRTPMNKEMKRGRSP